MLLALIAIGLATAPTATGVTASAPCADKTDKCGFEQWASLCDSDVDAGSKTSTDRSVHELANCKLTLSIAPSGRPASVPSGWHDNLAGYCAVVVVRWQAGVRL